MTNNIFPLSLASTDSKKQNRIHSFDSLVL